MSEAATGLIPLVPTVDDKGFKDTIEKIAQDADPISYPIKFVVAADEPAGYAPIFDSDKMKQDLLDGISSTMDLLQMYYTDNPINASVAAAFQTDPTTLGVLNWFAQLSAGEPYNATIQAFLKAHPEMAQAMRDYIADPSTTLEMHLQALLAPGSTIQDLMDELSERERTGYSFIIRYAYAPVTEPPTSETGTQLYTAEEAQVWAKEHTKPADPTFLPGGAMGDVTYGYGYTYTPPAASASTIIQGLSTVFNITGVLPENFEDTILRAVSTALMQATGVKPAGHL